MEFFEAVENRRSVRKYEQRPVPQEELEKLLEAARLAPSSSNTQSWKFKVIPDRETKELLRAASFNQKFVEEAPVVLACCVDLDAFKEQGRQTLKLVTRGGVRPSFQMMLRMARGGKGDESREERTVVHGIMNVSIATEHIALAATALGLGTCWVRAFESAEVERILELPEGVFVLCLLTVGYPAQEPAPRPRKKLEEILV